MKACFNKFVPKPPNGVLTKQQIVRLVGDLRASEQAKSDCGKRLINWYETQAQVFAK